MNQQQLSALLQLSSPALPIGGFSYSQAFEAAVDIGLITNEADAYQWIEQLLLGVFASSEAPAWVLMYRAWSSKSFELVDRWNQWFWSTRETHELRLETEQMGWSLVRLAQDLSWGSDDLRKRLESFKPITFPCAHSYVAMSQSIPLESGLTAYAFSWIENQVMAAIKTIPLGQVAGQRILKRVSSKISVMSKEAINRASEGLPRLNTFSHQLAILSSRHETQYSRLFRS